MTTKEKAARYDALQCCIRLMLEGYRKRAQEHYRQYREMKDVGVIGAYAKGLADGFWHVAQDMVRWID